ncbi:MAG: dihydrofolate reductase [Treponema sp.]|nr:dihydrofolate reductase [Treponema sp.]
MIISLLVAYSKNRVIGNKGKIPWNLPSERNRFKQICQGKNIIMGRKSFEEIGHALPYCTIVILSKTLNTCPQGCLLAKTPEEALSLCKNPQNEESEILVAGGSEIYQMFLPLTKKIYATLIDEEFEGDRFFPPLDENWEIIFEEEKAENNINFQYLTFVRKSKNYSGENQV